MALVDGNGDEGTVARGEAKLVNFILNLIAGLVLGVFFAYLYIREYRKFNIPIITGNKKSFRRLTPSEIEFDVFSSIFLVDGIIFYVMGVIGRGNVFGISFEKETFPSSGIERFISTRLLIIFIAGGFYAFACAGVGTIYANAIGASIGKWTCVFLVVCTICVLFWVVTFTVGTRSPVLIASLIGFIVSYKLLKPRLILHKTD